MDRGQTTPISTGDGVLVVRGAIDRGDVSSMCRDTDAFVRACDSDTVICNVAAVTAPDLAAVEALARMALTARRLGRDLRLQDADPELCSLLSLAGLSEVLPPVEAERGDGPDDPSVSGGEMRR